MPPCTDKNSNLSLPSKNSVINKEQGRKSTLWSGCIMQLCWFQWGPCVWYQMLFEPDGYRHFKIQVFKSTFHLLWLWTSRPFICVLKLQCDPASGLDCMKYGPDSCEHVQQVIEEILVKNVQAVRKKKPTWTHEQQLQGNFLFSACIHSSSDNITTDMSALIVHGHDYKNRSEIDARMMFELSIRCLRLFNNSVLWEIANYFCFTLLELVVNSFQMYYLVFFSSSTGAIAAYNFGVKNVQSWSGLDTGSSGDDYSGDAIARAQYLICQKDWKYCGETCTPTTGSLPAQGVLSKL